MARTKERSDSGLLSRLPFYALLALISSLGFIQVGLPLFGRSVVLTDGLFLLAGGLLGMAVLLRQIRLRWDAFFWTAITYLVALGVSTIFSSDRAQSLKIFPVEIYLVCLSYVAFALIDNAGRLKAVILAWLAGTLFAVAVGIFSVALFYVDRGSFLLEYLTYHYGAVPVGNFPRITATFASASLFCNYLNVALILMILGLRQNWIRHTLGYVLILGILLCSAFTVSIGLGGIFLALGLVSVVVLRHYDIKARALAISGVAAALLFVIVSVFALSYCPDSEVWATAFDIKLMPSSRFFVWRDALQTFLQHSITGIGLGLPVANTVVTNTDGSKSLLTDAHNSYLNVAAQNGLLGLAAIIAITMYLLRRWISVIKGALDAPFTRGIGLAFFCSFVYQGLTGSFEEARHLWVLMGMFVAAYRIENEP
jgi:O-antigen ligase